MLSWRVTWWAALWYLRCMAWLLLLSPLLLWLYRRISFALIGLPLGADAGIDHRALHGRTVGGGGGRHWGMWG